MPMIDHPKARQPELPDLTYMLLWAASSHCEVFLPRSHVQPGWRQVAAHLPRLPSSSPLTPTDGPSAVQRELIFKLHWDELTDNGSVPARLVSGHEDFVRHWVGARFTSSRKLPPRWWFSSYRPPSESNVCGIVDAPPGLAWPLAQALLGPAAEMRFVDEKPRDWTPPFEGLPDPVDLSEARAIGGWPNEFRNPPEARQ
jgi:hypothetical protein